jgi:hypothetical protein
MEEVYCERGKQMARDFVANYDPDKQPSPDVLWHDVVAAQEAIANAAHDGGFNHQTAVTLAARLTDAVKAYGLRRAAA